MIDKASKDYIEPNDFFTGIKTIVYAWLILGSVIGLFYFSFPLHWG